MASPKLNKGFSLKEGEYLNLTSSTVPRFLKCRQCNSPSTMLWDILVDGGRYTFCRGRCAYLFLCQRASDSEYASKLCALIESTPVGAAADIITLRGAHGYAIDYGFRDGANAIIQALAKKWGLAPNTASEEGLEIRRRKCYTNEAVIYGD